MQMPSLPDVPRMANPGLYELLQAMRRITLGNARAIAEGGLGDGSGGGTGDAERDPPSLVLDYGGDVDATAALTQYQGNTEAHDIYARAGTYTTTRLREDFTKHYSGRGQYLLADRVAPPNFGFLKVKPDISPVQGYMGWFAADQKFTDGGEWKIIGPDVRTYDLEGRYFESTMIPHHVWWEVESGNSGIQAYCTSGVTPGTTVTISGKASPEWVGKKCVINQSFGGTTLSPALTVASVLNNTVTFTAAHSVTMAWNPAVGNAPNLSFAPRTWGGHTYVLVRGRGGGDIYGHIVRMLVEYQPKVSELVHTFNSMTGGQYGGSVDFINLSTTLTAASSTSSTTLTVSTMNATLLAALPGKRIAIRPWVGGPVLTLATVVSCTATTIVIDTPPTIVHPIASVVSMGSDGTYATGWESQYNDQGADVSVIAQVDSFARLNDRADQGGRVWMGTLMQASGTPADVAHAVSGRWRRGLDTVAADLSDGSYLLDPTLASSVGIKVKWASGARIGHIAQISYGTMPVYQGVITAVSGQNISLQTAVGQAYPANSRVEFIGGGAAISMKRGQWINWNATIDQAGRSSDPLGVWGVAWGNKTGDIWSGADGDASSDYWQTQVGEGRIRLRATSFNMNVALQTSAIIVAGEDLVTNGSSINGSWQGAVVFGQGLGEQIVFNPVTNKYEFYINSAVVFSIP
jgi:hypothetical protein